MTDTTWGRVDASGTVFVIDEGVEREVGAYPGVPVDEALAYFVRKFDDIAVSINLLERRIATGSPAADIAKGLATIKSTLEAGVGVGDFASLRGRVAVLDEKLVGAKGEADAHREEAKQQALAARSALVVKIEALASSNLSNVNWKSTTAEVDALFEQWQAAQKSGAKVSKEQADEMWKRFRNARATIDRARRTHFATVDSAGKEVKARKEALIAKAQELIEGSQDRSIDSYRALLEQWKAAGRASKKVDDALWAKFKAAGDAIYSKKKESDDAEDASYADNLVVKEAILAEGQALLSMINRDQARALLSALQRRWDAAGKVPRAKVKDVEGGMRKLELAVKKLDDDAWSASNPEKQARQEGLAGAIEAKIAKLEKELATATASKDAKKVAEITEAIATQKSWLAVLPN
jgi:hypothetical protein